jgi:hypothetical protein
VSHEGAPPDDKAPRHADEAHPAAVPSWERGPADLDASLSEAPTDATVPVGAVSPFAHWTDQQTHSDGTPLRLEPASVEAPHRSFLHDSEQTVQVPMNFDEPEGLAPAPATLPLGTTHTSAIMAAPLPQAPSTLPLSTALPPRPPPTWGAPAPLPSPMPQRRAWLPMALGCGAVLAFLCVSLLYIVLAHH